MTKTMTKAEAKAKTKAEDHSRNAEHLAPLCTERNTLRRQTKGTPLTKTKAKTKAEAKTKAKTKAKAKELGPHRRQRKTMVYV